MSVITLVAADQAATLRSPPMPPLEAESEAILEAIRRKVWPYRTADICKATRLSTAVVEKQLRQLERSGLVVEWWNGVNGPFWELP
jgi:uncharacterized membrane protein